MRRSTLRPAARLAGTGVAAGLTLVVLLVLSAGGLSAREMTPAAPPSLTAAVSGACLGASAPTTATGSLVLLGNATPAPSVAGVSVTVDYFYTMKEVIGFNLTNESCVAASASNVTGAGGTISVPLPVPVEVCNPDCYVFEGPYGPLGYASSGAPEGFVERDPTAGTSPGTIDWYPDLYEATLNLTGTHIVSTYAPVDVSASAWNSVGGPAPGSLSYRWEVAGLEWTNSSNGPDDVAEGTDSGWAGSLSVTVTTTYGPTTESVQSSVLSLVPVSTRAFSGTTSATPVDPGVPVTFYVTGSGAPGYPYTATVSPGLGAAPANGPCETTPLPNGTANLTCQVQAAYPAAGIALPTASISNGYSTGEVDLAPVPVHPVEQVTLHAPSLVTYLNRPIALTVNVTNGTGSGPYGPACLSVNGAPGLTCQFANATSWAFNVAWDAPGEYELRASVTDRFGENVSATTGVLVVPFLSARANGSSSITLVANQTQALSVVVAGGALPITLWWNLSRSTSFLCLGILDIDGTVACPYEPTTVGATNLTVTLRDALGSETSVVFHLTVDPAPVHPPSTGSVFSGASGEILFGVLAALAGGVLLLAWDVRRRRGRPAGETGGDRVEDHELERMARGREHLLAESDLVTPRRPEELVAHWRGPPVAPEEWAEWLAALVADGSLIPSRGPDGRLVYRRAAPRPATPTIEFDPTALEGTQGPRDDASEPSSGPRDP
jgi:hypothetical protein